MQSKFSDWDFSWQSRQSWENSNSFELSMKPRRVISEIIISKDLKSQCSSCWLSVNLLSATASGECAMGNRVTIRKGIFLNDLLRSEALFSKLPQKKPSLESPFPYPGRRGMEELFSWCPLAIGLLSRAQTNTLRESNFSWIDLRLSDTHTHTHTPNGGKASILTLSNSLSLLWRFISSELETVRPLLRVASCWKRKLWFGAWVESLRGKSLYQKCRELAKIGSPRGNGLKKKKGYFTVQVPLSAHPCGCI